MIYLLGERPKLLFIQEKSEFYQIYEQLHCSMFYMQSYFTY